MATVIEPLPNAMFAWSWKTSIKCWRTFPASAQEFYSYSRGRQSSRGAFALRFDARRIVYRYK